MAHGPNGGLEQARVHVLVHAGFGATAQPETIDGGGDWYTPEMLRPGHAVYVSMYDEPLQNFPFAPQGGFAPAGSFARNKRPDIGVYRLLRTPRSWKLTHVIFIECDEHDHIRMCPLSEVTRDLLLATEVDRVGVSSVTIRVNPDATKFRKKPSVAAAAAI